MEGQESVSDRIVSEVTDDGQTTIPRKIRESLHVQAGDSLVYEVEGDAVRIRKASPFDTPWYRSIENTLEEWNSPEDDEVFGGL